MKVATFCTHVLFDGEKGRTKTRHEIREEAETAAVDGEVNVAVSSDW